MGSAFVGSYEKIKIIKNKNIQKTYKKNEKYLILWFLIFRTVIVTFLKILMIIIKIKDTKTDSGT